MGELIYGLEYRGEPISTSYELRDKDEKIKNLVLPKGLYIIGTMNTADRSIGSMDYAVRRRFAFVQVPSNPDCIKSSWEDDCNGELAYSLYDALITNSEGIFSEDLLQDKDMDVEDIKIGHTYFLGKPGQGLDYLKYRIEYQIYPIYQEYMKDGLIKMKEGKQKFAECIKKVAKDKGEFQTWTSKFLEERGLETKEETQTNKS